MILAYGQNFKDLVVISDEFERRCPQTLMFQGPRSYLGAQPNFALALGGVLHRGGGGVNTSMLGMLYLSHKY